MPEEVFISYGSADRERIQDLVPGSGTPVSLSGSTRPASRAPPCGARKLSPPTTARYSSSPSPPTPPSPRTSSANSPSPAKSGETILPVFLFGAHRHTRVHEIPVGRHPARRIFRRERGGSHRQCACALSALGHHDQRQEPGQALGQAPAAPARPSASPPPSRSRQSQWSPCSRQSFC